MGSDYCCEECQDTKRLYVRARNNKTAGTLYVCPYCPGQKGLHNRFLRWLLKE